MSQWGQGQPGYQYPLQTGYPGANPQFQQNSQFQQNPQFQQQGLGPGMSPMGGLAPQPTGFPGQRPQAFQQTGFQQPQQTGFSGASGFLQAQPTGFQRPPVSTGAPSIPPVPPIPTQFQQQQTPQNSGFLGTQVNRFLSPSPALGGPGLAAQPTGFAPRSAGGFGGAPLVPQMTGFVSDPRLQMMQSTFMPANTSAPYSIGGAPQLVPQQQQLGGLSLQQSFQQHNQAQRGTVAPKVPWALSKDEKRNYDKIFRAWDAHSTGFISGETALEVFGQSGLDKNDLARIWTLADADNRGKLNLAEFHVAMGLIYRRLNGNDIPDVLPPELVPPSSRDLDASVTFLKDVLKNDTRARSPSGLDTPVSKLKDRSFNSTASGAGGRQDATVYKYSDDSSPPGGFYQPRSRHVDRAAVRTRSDDDSPSADLSDMKRQLENTAKMLDRSTEADAARTAEDEELEREMSDLKYRVKRVQEDLEYVSRGPRTSGKDEERRRLERELLKLMHERVPEVERKIKDREERKAREKREWQRDRDRKNDRFGRYDEKESRSSPLSRYRDEDDHDGRYSRNTYDREDRSYDRDRERDRDRDRSYRERSRSRDRDYGRRSPPVVRSPPPPPPPTAPTSVISKPPPPAPAPSMKKMTPEERRAFVSAEAKRRLEQRMQALGVNAPSSTPTLDTTVEDRLAQEKKEAEAKSKAAEKQAEERESSRRQKLENEKALKEGRTISSPTTPIASASASATPPAPSPAAVVPKVAPPVPKARAPAPPPPRKTPAARPTVTARVTPAPPTPAAALTLSPPAPRAPAVPQVDPEEERIKAREAELLKQREARAARLRQLEEEEEEARRAEEQYQTRRQAFLNAKSTPPAPSPVTVASVAKPPTPPPPPPPVPSVVAAAEPPPVAASPPPPSAPIAASATGDKSHNPFSRLLKEGSVSSPTPPAVSTNGSTNPFFRSQTAPIPTAPPPSKSPAPPAVKTSYHTAPGNSEDEWDEINEKEEDSDSEDELDSSRDTRNKLAQQLFGNILPTARPQSAAAGTTNASRSATSTPAPPAPPPPPSAPPAPAAPTAPPPPPAAPPAPFAPPAPPAPPTPVVAAPVPTGDRSALLGAIQGGARLKKAVTNDRSAAPVSGQVLGDSAPPSHINATPRPVSPPTPVAPVAPAAFLPPPQLDVQSIPMISGEDSHSSKRYSVGWFAELAADEGVALNRLPSTTEEDEYEGEHPHSETPVPYIQVTSAHLSEAENLMDDVDKAVEHRVRSLYPYEGQRPEDLTFGENLILTAHPSRSGGDWWYGTLIRGGKSGFFPKTYVQTIQTVKAKAIYAYAGDNADELPFAEGDDLTIVDRSESDWWKAEQGGVVFIVPAAYLEVVEVATSHHIDTMPSESLDLSHLNGHSERVAEMDERAKATGDIDDSDESDYLSFSDDSDSEEEKDTKADREAREHERQLVLEAAGLIVNQDEKPPARVTRARSVRKRRPPPAAPQRLSNTPHTHANDLPSLPSPRLPVEDHAVKLDDAFDRYEAFKESNKSLNRLSVISADTTYSSPAISPSSSITPSLSKDDVRSSFLHFLGRKTPGNEGEKRTVPTISAPIRMDVLSQEDSSSFGSSWASLVDKTALEGIPPNERRRQEVIFELIATEAAYVRDLQLIVEVFYGSILSLLDRKAITVVFANIEDLLLTNTTFLSSLEERQKECRLYIDKIGDVLHKHMSNMDIYMEYCVNQGTAIKVLQSLRESKPELALHLQQLRDDPSVRNLDLSSYLLAPMQRITRYPLLIRQVLNYTDMTQDRQEIELSLHIAEKILNRINETIREQEGRERLRAISRDLWVGQGRLDLTAPTRYMGPRKLLKEGLLYKAKSGRKLRGFLCSDIMVFVDETSRSLYRMPLSLAEIEVREVAGGRDDLSFQVATAYPRGGDAISLRATSVRDCHMWMQAIDTARRKCVDAQKRASARQNRRG